MMVLWFHPEKKKKLLDRFSPSSCSLIFNSMSLSVWKTVQSTLKLFHFFFLLNSAFLFGISLFLNPLLWIWIICSSKNTWIQPKTGSKDSNWTPQFPIRPFILTQECLKMGVQPIMRMRFPLALRIHSTLFIAWHAFWSWTTTWKAC